MGQKAVLRRDLLQGDPRAPVAIVLDNPGAREREGAAWVCPTRETLRAAAREAGLRDLYVTWLVKFRPRRAYDKPAARALGREEVIREIDRVIPRVIVALGDVAAPTLLDDPGDGTVLTRTLDAYKLPTIADVPEIVCEFVDVPDEHLTSLGSKGLGEPAKRRVPLADRGRVLHSDARACREEAASSRPCASASRARAAAPARASRYPARRRGRFPFPGG